MDSDTARQTREWFIAYVNGFREASGEFSFAIQLKIQHSHRVAADARGIAADSGWTAHDIVSAETLGLLHDVGRFSQYAEYRTYVDGNSVDHADRGVGVLQASEILNAWTPQERQRMLDGVGLHNRKELSAGVAPDSLPFVELIRDADKLDIFHVVQDGYAKKWFEREPELFLRMTPDVRPSAAFIDGLKDQRNLSYHEGKTFGDILLIQIMWMYEIHFQATLKRILERGVIEKIASLLPAEGHIVDAIEAARAHAVARVSEAQDA